MDVSLILFPWQFLLTPVLTSVIGSLMALHYAHLTTGSPIEVKSALEYRRGLAEKVFMVGLFWPFLLPYSLVLVGLHPKDAFKAFASWLTYNRFRLRAGGINTGLGGPRPVRLLLLYLWCVLVPLSLPIFPPTIAPSAESILVRVTIGLFVAFLAIAISLLVLMSVPAPLFPGLGRIRRNVDYLSRMEAVRESPNAAERECIWLGTNAVDGIPFLLPARVAEEHIWVKGSPGSGKTVRLMLLLMALLSFKRYSLHVIDLKGDSFELLGAILLAARKLRLQIRIQKFIDRVGWPTSTYNVFEQRFWRPLTPVQKAVVLAGVLGGSHGLAGYGKQWFGGAYVQVLLMVFSRCRNIRSWRGLAEAIIEVIVRSNSEDCHADIRNAGLQVWLDVSRMAQVEAFNVVDNPNGIDLCKSFEEPGIVYWCLPPALSHDMAGCAGRLAIQGLIDASICARRTRRVFGVVDEFQRAVAEGLELCLEQARSMDLSFVLANQSASQLDRAQQDFSSLVKTCCRTQWTVDTPDPEEQREISQTSGKYIDHLTSISQSGSPNGPGWSKTRQEVVLDRLSINAVKLASSSPDLSIITVSRDHSFCQYLGYPNIIRTPHFLSKADYEALRHTAWEPDEGSIVTQQPADPEDDPSNRIPEALITREVIRRGSRRPKV